MMNKKRLLRLYAADPDTGAGGGTDGQQPTGGEQESGKEASPFDMFLSDPKNQAEFDRRVNKALETVRTNFESQKQTAINEALNLQKMTDDQKAAYAQRQAEQELAKRDAELTRRELRLNAIDTLAAKDLPVELADALSYTSADDCDTSMKSVVKAFEKAVSKAVDAKLRQAPPKAGEQNTGDPIGAIRAAAGLK